ncbi:MAG: dTMP kinase [Desulfobacterales bacterium]|nr:dTMP kinase [Desulfobacterales bacterium]
MLSNNIFIVIEGIDGAGKTTISKLLSEKISACFYKTPSGFWLKHRHLVENKSSLIRFLYYSIALIDSSRKISKILKNKAVICDRYIYSTWAYHIAYGCRFLKYIPFYILPIITPDVICYLYVSKEERLKRIINRENNTNKDFDSAALEKIHNIFMEYKDMIVIDTTNLSKEEVIEILYSAIIIHKKYVISGKYER